MDRLQEFLDGGDFSEGYYADSAEDK